MFYNGSCGNFSIIDSIISNYFVQFPWRSADADETQLFLFDN